MNIRKIFLRISSTIYSATYFVRANSLRLGIAAVVTIVYTVLRFAYGPGITPLSVIPISFIAWYFGLRVGLTATVIFLIPVFFPLFDFANPNRIADFMLDGSLAGSIALTGLSVIVGMLHDARARLERELVERTLVEKALRENQYLVQRIMETTPNIIYIYDLHTRQVVYSNHQFKQPIPDLATEETKPTSPTLSLAPENQLQFEKHREQFEALTDGQSIEWEYHVSGHNDQWQWWHTQNVVFNRNPNDTPRQILGIAHNITNRKQMEKELRYLSTHDTVTGLHNRAYFDETITQLELEQCTPVSVIVADVDRLKVVNDTYGHAAGDELLRRTAVILASAVRVDDVVARIGGDEFAILLPRTPAPRTVTILDRIYSELKTHNAANAKLPEISISIGMATANHDEPIASTLARADDLMYRNKPKRF